MRAGHLPPTLLEKKLLDGGAWQIKPHPDGKPWPKCCRFDKETLECKCFVAKPKAGVMKGISRCESMLADDNPYHSYAIRECIKRGLRFFCVHRMDGGYHRVCAGWAAKYGSK